MPCLLLILALAFPRVVLILMWLFTNLLDRAFHGMVIPLIGFIFLPMTTVAYAWVVGTGRPLDGIYLVVIILGVLLDLGSHTGSARYRRVRA